MTVHFVERFDSREWEINRDATRTTCDLKYSVIGTEDDLVAANTVRANAPPYWHGLRFQSHSMEHKGGGTWDVVCSYGLSDPEESTFNFDTTGATTHITQSVSTSGRYGNAPDLQGAIGFDGDHVQGTDIQIPRYSWNETHTMAAARFTAAYRYSLYTLTSRINNAVFRGFAVGEVQFQGASGAQRGNHDVEITFYFEASPNLSGLTVGAVTGISKAGWDHIWVRYKNTEDTSTKRIIATPDGVYVEQLFYYGSFSALGIGVA